MNQNISAEWSKTERIIFRLGFCYLSFYFIFLGGFLGEDSLPFLGYIHAPFQYISDTFIGFVNRLFIHNKYDKDIYTGLGDTSWFCIAMLSYFIMSILATVVWTTFDKRKNYVRLYTYLQIYARYYLAFVLIVYGIAKLTGEQFPEPLPDWLSQPTGNMDSHTLLWLFMGASKSYNFFSGFIEVLAGGLLLFKKTSTLGSLMGIAMLTNVLILNIAYDTLVKTLLFHLIIIEFYILAPNIKRVFNFFVLNKPAALTIIPTPFQQNKSKWVAYSLKFILIGYVIFYHMMNFSAMADAQKQTYFDGIDGIYDIKEYYRNQERLLPLTTDTVRWKGIVINKFNFLTVQFMNDSILQYSIQPDSINKSIALSLWNDSTFKSKLNYSLDNSGNYVFEGIYKKDSIRFISTKVNLQNYPLLKDKGKVKWVWW